MSAIQRIRIAASCILLGCWALFAICFISRTSHVSLDGVRYFALFDDGMISMRYAKNLVEHHQLVWNLGDRVEGFSNPLWTFIMAIVIWLFGTLHAPLAMQILGGIICLAIFLVFCRNTLRNNSSPLALAIGLLILSTSYTLAYWALTGMEACAICLGFAVAIGSQLSYENGHIGNPLIGHACLIAASYAIRPDGWLGIAPLFAACWLDSVRQKKYREALGALVIVAATVSAVLLARHAYYGEWVPNTYVLKVVGYSLALRLRNGSSFVLQFCTENFSFLFLIALAALSKRRIAFLNIISTCIVLGYQVYVGGDPWLYWRQLLPVYVAAAFSVLLIFDHLDRLSILTCDAPPLSLVNRALLLTAILAPIALYEYVLALGGTEPLYRRTLLETYLVVAFASYLGLGFARFWAAPGRNSNSLIFATRLLIVIVAAYATIFANMRFLPELRGQPYLFEQQAELIDKAVLSTRLFGSGKTHHLVWAGTYPYYVEGKMIDSLGKSDKLIARYPVDENVAWYGMRGVPGHAKHDFRDTLLGRKPDIIVDFTSYAKQDTTKDIESSYTLIVFNGVSLCVKNELAARVPSLTSGKCPQAMLSNPLTRSH